MTRVICCRLCTATRNMGLLCSKHQQFNQADTEENAQVNILLDTGGPWYVFPKFDPVRAEGFMSVTILPSSYFIFPIMPSICFSISIFQAADIERRIEQETRAEKHIHKLLLLGTPNSFLFVSLLSTIRWARTAKLHCAWFQLCCSLQIERS